MSTLYWNFFLIKGHFTLESLWPLQPIVSHWWKMPSLSHFSFTLELEGLWDQGSLNDLTYLYRALHGMQWILLHALPDFVTTQNHYSSCMIQPSDELQDSSQFHGHGPCHKCKVALWYKLFSLRTLQNLLMRMLIPFFLIFFFLRKKWNPECLPSWEGTNLCSDLLRKSFLVDSDYWLAVRIFQLHESSIIGLI